MQVTINVTSVPEARLVAAFMQDYADLLELQHVPQAAPEQPTVEEAPVKKSRAKKTDPVVTTAASSSSEQETVTAAPVAESAASTQEAATTTEGNDSATTAEAATESGSSETAEPVTTDDLRKLFGELSQNGKRDEAVKIVRSYGFNAIKDISADKLDEIHGKLKAL